MFGQIHFLHIQSVVNFSAPDGIVLVVHVMLIT